MPRIVSACRIVTIMAFALTAIGCDESAPKTDATPSSAPPAVSGATDGGVRFGRTPVKVGDKHTTSLKMETATERTNPELPGVTEKSSIGFHLVVDAEVLAVSKGQESKWKAHYPKAQMIMKPDEQSENIQPMAAVVGKTYIVEKKNGKLTVTSADGKPVQEEEAPAYIRMPFTAESATHRALPQRPIMPGELVPWSMAQAGQKQGGKDDTTLRARFLKKQGDSGLFETSHDSKEVAQTDNSPAANLVWTCRSTVRIADGRVRSSICSTGKKQHPTGEDKSKYSSEVTVTFNRTYAGDPPAKATVPATAPPEAKATAFDAICYGEKDLTETQRLHITMSQHDQGIDRCPGLSKPTVVFGDSGLTVNGQALVSKGERLDGDNLAKLEPLFKRLNIYRERRKSLFRIEFLKGFDGKVTIKPAAGTASAPVISALVSAALAGYASARIEMGSVAVELVHFFPGPSPDAYSPTRVLYVEPLDDGKVMVGFLRAGPWLTEKTTLASIEQFDSWLTSHCEKSTEPACGVKRLIFRARKVPIEEPLKNLQSVFQAKALAGKTIMTSLEFGCVDTLAPSFEQAMKGPWGPRSPDTPCYAEQGAEKSKGTAKVRKGAATVSGRLKPEVIHRTVEAHFHRFRRCYENGLRKKADLAGRLSVRFAITKQGTGAPEHVAGGGDLPDKQVIGCVERVFHEFQFPKPESGVVTVSYPLVFSPK